MFSILLLASAITLLGNSQQDIQKAYGPPDASMEMGGNLTWTYYNRLQVTFKQGYVVSQEKGPSPPIIPVSRIQPHDNIVTPSDIRTLFPQSKQNIIKFTDSTYLLPSPSDFLTIKTSYLNQLSLWGLPYSDSWNCNKHATAFRLISAIAHAKQPILANTYAVGELGYQKSSGVYHMINVIVNQDLTLLYIENDGSLAILSQQDLDSINFIRF